MYSFGSIYAQSNLKQSIHFTTECNKWLLDHAINRNKIVIADDFDTCYNISDHASVIIDKTLTTILDKTNLIDSYSNVNPT